MTNYNGSLSHTRSHSDFSSGRQTRPCGLKMNEPQPNVIKIRDNWKNTSLPEGTGYFLEIKKKKLDKNAKMCGRFQQFLAENGPCNEKQF